MPPGSIGHYQSSLIGVGLKTPDNLNCQEVA